jgi:hypothetical protein
MKASARRVFVAGIVFISAISVDVAAESGQTKCTDRDAGGVRSRNRDPTVKADASIASVLRIS